MKKIKPGTDIIENTMLMSFDIKFTSVGMARLAEPVLRVSGLGIKKH